MHSSVWPLEDAPDDPALVGGKAAGLVRLARAGLPVPPGFAIGVEAMRAVLRDYHLDEANAAHIERLRAVRWPDDLRRAVGREYETLRARADGAPVAVRSSATAEDSAGASFAGQHATLLNLHSLDAVLEGIAACWASLSSEEARQYRRSRGLQDDGPSMAVVVQALVPAQASGVAFTLDPVSGDRDVVVIDAALGLGEGVVSGAVTPDHFAVRKADGAVVRRAIATKHVRVVADDGGGTRQEAIAGDAPALSDDQVVELARLALRVEELMGGPQDLEWAVAGGRFALLQARPVTAAGHAEGPPAPAEGWVSEFDTPTHPETIWTAANVQEVLPDQLSPFNCSINRAIIEQYGTEPIRRLGIRLTTQDPFFAFFYGRAFLNVTMMLEVADQTPFGSPEALMEQFFGRARGDVQYPKQRSLSRLWRYLVVLPRMLWQSARMPSDVRRAERIVARFEREDAARPCEDRPDEELLRLVDERLPLGAEVSVIHVSGGGLTSSNFEWLRRLTERWLDDENGRLQARLCTGLASVESAQPAYELWDLSRLVLASDRLREAFDVDDAREIERRLAALAGDDIDAFRRRLDTFLERHGHRSVMEAEPAAKSWSEDLATVFGMIKGYLHADDSFDPRRLEARQRHERETATEESLRRLRRWRRPVFRYVLGQAQEWVATREHTKSLMVRSIHRGRLLTRELARRMTDRGLLDDPWDFYDLTWDEVRALFHNELSRDEAYRRVARRRDETRRNRDVVLPETFSGRPAPLRPDEQPLPDGHALHGIPVSPGRATGRARVILDPRRDAGIEPGEILVAPVTDAGWTPLFITAAGVVVDIGGSLSHGSTVAREYGLPAVVNVKHGTRRIRTGQTVTVDGSLGVVIIED